MSNSANARPRKSSGIACCMIVSAEIFATKNAKKPENNRPANAASVTHQPNTRLPAPSNAIEPRSIRIGGTESFHFCASTMPIVPPRKPSPPISPRASVSAVPPSTRFFA